MASDKKPKASTEKKSVELTDKEKLGLLMSIADKYFRSDVTALSDAAIASRKKPEAEGEE